MIDLKNTYFDCKNLSADERMIYLKACIGDDLPHEKMCGYGSHSKDEILNNYLCYATFLYFSPSGMMSYDECAKPCRMTQQKIITLADLKSEQEWNGEGLPPVGVECEAYCYKLREYVKVKTLNAISNSREVAVTTIEEMPGEEVYGRLFWAREFRPIETPEQKAAREGEELVQYWVVNEMKPIDVAKKLIEQGYRKPE